MTLSKSILAASAVAFAVASMPLLTATSASAGAPQATNATSHTAKAFVKASDQSVKVAQKKKKK